MGGTAGKSLQPCDLVVSSAEADSMRNHLGGFVGWRVLPRLTTQGCVPIRTALARAWRASQACCDRMAHVHRRRLAAEIRRARCTGCGIEHRLDRMKNCVVRVA